MPGAPQPPSLPPPPPPASSGPSSGWLAVGAVGMLLFFVIIGLLVFGPDTFTQRLITFGVAAGLTIWIVSVIDGAQRRTLERMQRRMELLQQVAVAEAIARERGHSLDAFLESFVANVNSSIGQFPPNVTYSTPWLLPGSTCKGPGCQGSCCRPSKKKEGAVTAQSSHGPRTDPADD